MLFEAVHISGKSYFIETAAVDIDAFITELEGYTTVVKTIDINGVDFLVGIDIIKSSEIKERIELAP